MTITADVLRTWAERLCTLASTEAAELLRELAAPSGGTVVPRFGALVIDPPPPGTVEVKAISRKGKLDRLELQLAQPEPALPAGAPANANEAATDAASDAATPAAPLTRGALEPRFGKAGVVAPAEADGVPGASYRLVVADAPFACEIFVDFAAAGDAAVATGVSLRRVPAAARPKVGFSDVIDALRAIAAKGKAEEAARLGAADVTAQAAAVGERVEQAEAAAGELEARRVAAAEVEKLIATLARTGAAAGAALAKHGAQLQQLAANIDVGGLTASLRKFTEILANPTPDSEERGKEVLAQLRAAFPTVAARADDDERRAEEARRAEIKRDVQASLDEIFRGKKPAPES